MDISARIDVLKQELGVVTLGVVSKYSTLDETEAAILGGAEVLCESRVQDAELKISALGHYSVQWHMIGHLQSNKVKKAVRLFDCIQSVDSLELLGKIQSEAALLDKVVSVLLQVNIASDPKKFGFSSQCFCELIPKFCDSFLNVRIRGIMVIIPYEVDMDRVFFFFEEARGLFDRLKSSVSGVDTLSMGMSHDYRVAISSGATMVRIGSLIFKEATAK